MPNWTAPDGSQIHYEIHSATSTSVPAERHETLLVLPGLLGTMQSQWRTLLPELTSRFRLVRTDLRGYGRSTNKQTRLEPEQMIEDLFGMLNAIGVDQFHVAGYSLGGYLGLLLALAMPERVRSVLALATKFYWTRSAVADMKKQLDPDRLTEQAPAYAAQLSNEHGAARWRELARQSADLVAYLQLNGLSEEDLRDIGCPVLIAVGDRDQLVPLPEAARLSRIIPGAGLLVLPHTAHPFLALRPVPLVNVMQQFHVAPNRHG